MGKIRTKRYGFLDSIGAVFVGLAMIVASFIVIFIGEGREDLSKVAKNAACYSAQEQAAQQGKLIYTVGELNGAGTISDKDFLLPGDYLVLERHVQMYAWEETQHSEEDRYGDTSYWYTYDAVWTEYPENSSGFHDSSYRNPSKTYSSVRGAIKASINGLSVDLTQAKVPVDKLNIMPDMIPETIENVSVDSSYIYLDDASYADPDVGDHRIFYMVARSGMRGLLLGKLSGQEIVPFVTSKDNAFCQVFETDNLQAVVESLRTDHLILLWTMRGIGALLIWVGIMGLLAPILFLVRRIPLLGKASYGIVALLAIPIAALLAFVIVVISNLVRSPLAIAITAAVFVGIVIVLCVAITKNKKKKAAEQAELSPPKNINNDQML